jgi:hypothetical protein
MSDRSVDKARLELQRSDSRMLSIRSLYQESARGGHERCASSSEHPLAGSRVHDRYDLRRGVEGGI